jgi:hypothetical protein
MTTREDRAVERDRDEQTGTGTPRSVDDGLAQPGAAASTEPDPAVVTGATTGSQPAQADDVTPNRSGSGGSGGGLGDDEDGATEGGGSRSMEEMLGADATEAGQAPER